MVDKHFSIFKTMWLEISLGEGLFLLFRGTFGDFDVTNPTRCLEWLMSMNKKIFLREGEKIASFFSSRWLVSRVPFGGIL